MRRMKVWVGVSLVAVLFVWAQTPDVVAQGGVPVAVSRANTETQAATAQFWTAERMASAQPMIKIAAYNPVGSAEPTSTGARASSPPGAPAVAPTVNRVQLYDPADANYEPESEEGIAPQDRGTFGANYSSTRLTPTSADTAWPHRLIGKLYFNDPVTNQNFVCSASIIQRRVLATAGHCVHRGTLGGTNNGFYRFFQFVPALRNASAPFGTWNWAYVIVTGTWATGGGGVPNAADYAMIETVDQGVGRIGAYLGWLGWQTLSLSNNHANLMGYPCNLDSCVMMHQVTSQSFANGGNNTWTYGSDMRGGSSGGPWVQNFGNAAAGQTAGSNGGMNRVIAVTSWGYVSTAPKVQGASIPDSRWVSIWNTICAHRVGNCS